MDRNTLVAFFVGLVASVAFLAYLNGASKPRTALDPKEWKSFKLIHKDQISPNTASYRFALPNKNDVLGLPIGQHISVQAEINGKNVMRSYTPTSSDDDKGHFDLLIKTYPQGNISKYVDSLKLGDRLQVKGPKGQMRYSPQLARRIGMIAGGTGITPMLQIIRAALKNPTDRTQIDLLYANVKYEDILLREELEELAERHPQRFRVQFFLNEPPSGREWRGGVGFVSKEAIEEKLPAPANDIKILMCGPPPMITAMKKHLAELKYEAPATISKLEHQVFCF